MLIELRIRDYAVVDDLTLKLGPGLNALTGETGAGKSIIVGALSLLLGERALSEDVRTGAERAVVEGVFDVGDRPDVLERLDGMGLVPEEGLLILRREVHVQGRNRAWVNGSPATATTVGGLGTLLVDLHGQHEHQTLLRRAEQRAILDAYAAAEAEVAAVASRHAAWVEARRAVEEHEARARELASRADFLAFQLEEIEGARLEEGEEASLASEARKLEHAQELAQETTRVAELLYAGDDAVSERLADARNTLERLEKVDPDLGPLARLLEEAYYGVVEAGRGTGDYAAGIEHDPGRLEEIQQRQDVLSRLKRKYGPELDDVRETGARLRAEMDELEASKLDIREREAEETRAREALTEAATSLTTTRRAAAERLAGEVASLLPELGMRGAVVQVVLIPQDEPGPTGAEQIEFRVSLNPGFEPRSLARIASGGELSRIMLALKAILAREDRVPTLVFDEIDAGIGGTVATEVARTLLRVAEHHQVFVITHLPQLAARAGAHLLVSKEAQRGMAATSVAALDGEPRVREIARMLGGDPESETSREHARELMVTG
jgi:DNA repair protein RecN (Recombination protein N)